LWKEKDFGEVEEVEEVVEGFAEGGAVFGSGVVEAFIFS
jgi:hypothetical protein